MTRAKIPPNRNIDSQPLVRKLSPAVATCAKAEKGMDRMDANHSTTLAAHIRTYIRAKDENRPHLMQRAFAESAMLEMVVRTKAIAFPPVTHGCASITDILVRRFAKQYENVYTFCLSDPPSPDSIHFKCGWLVVMSEKDSGHLRAGFGHYDWTWNPNVAPLVDRLAITIERMDSFPPSVANPAFDWVESLTYPWCPTDQLGNHLPPGDKVRSLVCQAMQIRTP